MAIHIKTGSFMSTILQLKLDFEKNMNQLTILARVFPITLWLWGFDGIMLGTYQVCKLG